MFRHPLRLLLIFLLGFLMLSACGHPSKPKLYDPAVVRFRASYNPSLDGIIYPSMVMALANYTGPVPHPLFNVSVTAPTNNAVLRVVVDSSVLNYVTILQEVLPRKGSTYSFEPLVKWKFDKLYSLRQPGAVDFTFTCYINDEEVDVENLRLNFRNVNECPLSLMDTSGRVEDYRWLFAAYVNEDHPYIDSILHDILRQGIITTFTGYQQGIKEVQRQVLAIWHYALCRGITYSSISCTSNPSRRANAQHIRFFDEVYLSRQANCIDACVFFASIMRKIGLHPVILLEPCHAYLGYYTDRNNRKLALLETTCTAWVNYLALDASVDVATGIASDKELAKLKKFLPASRIQQYHDGQVTLDQLKREVSSSLFKAASDYDLEQYNVNRALFADTTQHGYQILDVEQLRTVVQPIMRP